MISGGLFAVAETADVGLKGLGCFPEIVDGANQLADSRGAKGGGEFGAKARGIAAMLLKAFVQRLRSRLGCCVPVR